MHFSIKCSSFLWKLCLLAFVWLIVGGVHYLAVDHSLAYSYTKLFLHCFSLILTLIFRLKVLFLDSYLDFCSCIYLFITLNFCHQFFPTCKSCFSILDSKRILTYIKGILCLRPYKIMLVPLSAHIFLRFLSLVLQTKRYDM